MPTKIPWCDESWSPIVGCSKCSPGCLNCWAERMACRQWHMKTPGYRKGGVVAPGEWVTDRPTHWSGHTAFVESQIDKPLHWRKPRRVFVCSMGDLFHESVPVEWITRVFGTMALCPQHQFQCLTKRPERMWFHLAHPGMPTEVNRLVGGTITGPLRFKWPLPNVWLGVTVCTQAEADAKIPVLLETPAAVRFVSIEPQLEFVDLYEHLWCDDGPACCDGGTPDAPCGCHGAHQWMPVEPGLDWVICGAESGPGRRPFYLDWARSLRDQCQEAGVPFFFKQAYIGGKKVECPELDGRQWVEFPTTKGGDA